MAALKALRPTRSAGLPRPRWAPFEPAALVAGYGAPACWHAAGRLGPLLDGEPAVTAALLACCPADAEPAGLDQRVKSVPGTCEKVRRLGVKHACTPAAAALRVTDVLRYTLRVTAAQALVPAAAEFISRAGAQGIAFLAARHYYLPGSRYKGLHLVGEEPHRRAVFEVQFHTEQEWELMHGPSHALYEVYRDPRTPRATARSALAELRRLAADLPHPPGLDRLEDPWGPLRACGGCRAAPS
ncbi:hypothetical protein [Streptomyces tateyamensis]|uniref:hypothetical protein n=1 Tax=Streptomyces tateyamensis TaxID=565073 RepID=UPI0011B60045|nr:hypothetical protein [Streptomyces tateyamensis]